MCCMNCVQPVVTPAVPVWVTPRRLLTVYICVRHRRAKQAKSCGKDRFRNGGRGRSRQRLDGGRDGAGAKGGQGDQRGHVPGGLLTG